MQLKQEHLKLNITRIYACDSGDFETNANFDLLILRKNDHEDPFEKESENEKSDDEYSMLHLHIQLYPLDNVAFHYGDKHNIRMNLKVVEANIKR